MRIALDFDGTYTEDPEFWNGFIIAAQRKDHTVQIVTFREKDTPLPNEDWFRDIGVLVFYTAREAKKRYMDRMGLAIDIWIDDNPDLICNPSEWTDDQYRLWKEQEQKNVANLGHK